MIEKVKKAFIFISPALILLLFLWLGFSLVNRWQGPISLLKKATPTSFPTPTLSIEEELLASPSAYADDETILKIEEDLKNLENDLNNVDLNENSLLPPNLDLQVEY